MTDYNIILCTCPDDDSAKQLATGLIENSLAACVNIVAQMTSIYMWKGKVCEYAEKLLIIKTHKNNYATISEFIKNVHPYELPEIIAVSIQNGDKAYFDWINQSITLEQ